MTNENTQPAREASEDEISDRYTWGDDDFLIVSEDEDEDLVQEDSFLEEDEDEENLAPE